MEFEEVNDFLRAGQTEPELFYNALVYQQQPVTRKPTLSNFVHRLKQHSSKTRFVSQYKKLSDNLTSDDEELAPDNVSIRIIDPIRSREEEEEEEVVRTVIKGEKKPMKRVMINESANQIRGDIVMVTDDHDEEISKDYITLDEAMTLIHKDLCEKHDDIEREMKRIEYNKEEIRRYRENLIGMQAQLDMYLYSLVSIQNDHLTDMKAHENKSYRNAEKIKETKRRNAYLKSRFEKFRQAISIDTRLMELERKIAAACKRDEIWAKVRDLILSTLLILLVISSFIAMADF
ncbi:uncharacterized protein EV154DRAFT_514612 [Mucor mucedo]|uniref:uncharacterized protein n=1 Tax=Mucor mucedo TaxID=29922 RepID=UPI00222065F7|nr:uncharacterized protein EV154DRAFT_514612 [Mucor mucedo]KAI7889414.1 hypothetical protein EV154DRAFT_514612 [Mucor mucedo]